MNQPNRSQNPIEGSAVEQSGENEGGLDESVHPLSIESLKQGKYPGSDLIVEQKLEPGSNYDRYLVSYKSDGLKIYSLLTVPQGDKPQSGWPVIVFNHGYIAPSEYRTTERYIAYTDAFSRNGYILLRPDYRGHGSSEGTAPGGYGSNAYTIDVMNAIESIKKYKDADEDKIGLWGHSMGGHITLRNMVVRSDIKVGVIWAGVVASYPDLVNNWRRGGSITPSIPSGARRWRVALVEQYGTPEENPKFWDSISSNTYLSDISGPVQIHHGTADTSVPVEFSEKLDEQLAAAGKEKELYIYEGDDHNLSNNLGIALDRSVAYFDRYLKE
jgi:dipeptidyl aminopeptidase/acylaminoacyl peptidase